MILIFSKNKLILFVFGLLFHGFINELKFAKNRDSSETLVEEIIDIFEFEE